MQSGCFPETGRGRGEWGLKKQSCFDKRLTRDCGAM
ncbi:MAG: hypothetical protein RLZZ244_866 [Verrucomicrobiota bacterium]|jgi:hypothetical protein